MLFPVLNPDPVMPAEDEVVEDAGLFDHESMLQRNNTRLAKTAN